MLPGTMKVSLEVMQKPTRRIPFFPIIPLVPLAFVAATVGTLVTLFARVRRLEQRTLAV